MAAAVGSFPKFIFCQILSTTCVVPFSCPKRRVDRCSKTDFTDVITIPSPLLHTYVIARKFELWTLCAWCPGAKPKVTGTGSGASPALPTAPRQASHPRVRSSWVGAAAANQ